MQSRIIKIRSLLNPYPLDIDITQLNQHIKVTIISALNNSNLIQSTYHENLIISNIIYYYLAENISIDFTTQYLTNNYNKYIKSFIYNSISSHNINNLYLHFGEANLISDIVFSYLKNSSSSTISFYNKNYGSYDDIIIYPNPTFYPFEIQYLINNVIVRQTIYSESMISNSTYINYLWPMTEIYSLKIDDYEKVNIIIYHKQSEYSGHSNIASILIQWNS